jgi:MoaA/NifB/PqqE/SkfB family radical SAM enzyme
MRLTGLHLLLTYTCNYECDHCFVWSGPSQPGTMRLEQIEQILEQASDLGTIEWIYFEGGEPFLYYAILLAGVRAAAERGFKVGIVSNAYWAADVTARRPRSSACRPASSASRRPRRPMPRPRGARCRPASRR